MMKMNLTIRSQHVPPATSFPLPLLTEQEGHSIGNLCSLRRAVTYPRKTFAAKGSVIRHLFQTYAAHERVLGGLGKLGALCGERVVLFVKFVLRPHRRGNAIRGWSWWLAKVAKCATGV